MRSRDVSARTQRSSFSSQSLRHGAILFLSFQSWFTVNNSLMNTSFFFFSTCWIHSPSKMTLPQWGVLVCGCRDLILSDEMGIFLSVSPLFLWEITPGALMEQQRIHAASLLAQAQWAGHNTCMCTHWAQPCRHTTSRSTHITVICWSHATSSHSPQLFFHYTAPWWHISSICLVTLHQSHLVLFKPNIYSTKWAFFLLLTLIIPILCWGVVHPLLKLDKKK